MSQREIPENYNVAIKFCSRFLAIPKEFIMDHAQ
jgi:hypothetical protein